VRVARQGGAGVRATHPADLLVGGEHEIDVVGGSLSAVGQQASSVQQGGDRGAVVEKVGADVVSDVDQRSLAEVDAHPGAGVDARGGQVFAAAAGEDVDVPPIQRSVALIGLVSQIRGLSLVVCSEPSVSTAVSVLCSPSTATGPGPKLPDTSPPAASGAVRSRVRSV
jgi:hypothetical protein